MKIGRKSSPAMSAARPPAATAAACSALEVV
jgi:hypothetical protein